MPLVNQKPLNSATVVVLFDGTRHRPMGRYLSPIYDNPAADSAPVPQRASQAIGPNVLGRNAAWRSTGPEAA